MNFTIRFTTPEASSTFGRWCEQHNVSFHLACILGQWHVTASRKAVISYSDERGSHTESWEVTRVGDDPGATLQEALHAIAKSSGIETLVEQSGRELAEASS